MYVKASIVVNQNCEVNELVTSCFRYKAISYFAPKVNDCLVRGTAHFRLAGQLYCFVQKTVSLLHLSCVLIPWRFFLLRAAEARRIRAVRHLTSSFYVAQQYILNPNTSDRPGCTSAPFCVSPSERSPRDS